MLKGFDLLKSVKAELHLSAQMLFLKLFVISIVLVGSIFLVPNFVGVVAIIAVVVVFTSKPQWVLYLMVSVGFLTGLQITLTNSILHTVFGFSFFTNVITAPVGDFIAFILFFSFVFVWPLTLHRDYKLQEVLPGGIWYGLFLLFSLVSLVHVYDQEISMSLKYWLRPMLFVYVCFVFLPMSIIRTQQIFLNVLHILFAVGTVIGMYGLSALFFAKGTSWLQTVPYALGSFVPLGTNHNLLAEPLVAIIPIGGWLAWYYQTRLHKYEASLFFIGGTMLMIVVCFLTFSRAAWLSLFFEVALISFFYKKQIVEYFKRLPQLQWVFSSILILAVVAMLVFLNTSFVSSSNLARASMTDISLSYFLRSPLLGYGPGTFMSILGDTKYFVMEYGEPLESHGFIQKILVEEGIVGLLFFMLFLSSVFKYIFTAYQFTQEYELGRTLLVMVVGVVFFQLFNTSYFSSTMWLPIGIALASANLVKRSHV